MNRQETKKRERERTPNNRTTTEFRISDELWAVFQPLLPVHVNTHCFGGGRPRASHRDRAYAIFYVPLERDANGKRAPSSNSGKQASSSLRSCVESTGTGSRWMKRCGIRRLEWGTNRPHSDRPRQERGETQPARPMGTSSLSASSLLERIAAIGSWRDQLVVRIIVDRPEPSEEHPQGMCLA